MRGVGEGGRVTVLLVCFTELKKKENSKKKEFPYPACLVSKGSSSDFFTTKLIKLFFPEVKSKENAFFAPI